LPAICYFLAYAALAVKVSPVLACPANPKLRQR
jgi:hypothetical protein